MQPTRSLIGLGALLLAAAGCVQDAAETTVSAAQFEPEVPEVTEPIDDGSGETSGEGEEPVTSDINVCDDVGHTAVLIVQQFGFVREESPAVSNGFNLDDAVDGASTGCALGDYVSPDGEEGIDNQFAQLLPVIEDVGGSAISTYLQDAITKGDLLIMFEIEDVDDWENDPCVHVSMGYGVGQPNISAHGWLEPWQSFDIAQERPWARIENAAIVDGRLEVGPVDLQVPFSIFDFAWVINVLDARIRIDFDGHGGGSGMMGGAIPVADMRQIVEEAEVGSGVRDAIELVADTFADLMPDEQGKCQAISGTLQHESVGAFFYEDAERPEPTP